MHGKHGLEVAGSAWRSPLPAVLTVCGWQLWPCPVLYPGAARGLFQASVGPSWVPTEPQPSRAAGQGGIMAPWAHLALCPCIAQHQWLLATPQGCGGRGGRGQAQAVPGNGAELAPTLP